ncbi:MAG: hypothetical protein ABEN55_20230 [Bradymonadaceae bacterium]
MVLNFLVETTSALWVGCPSDDFDGDRHAGLSVDTAVNRAPPALADLITELEETELNENGHIDWKSKCVAKRQYSAAVQHTLDGGDDQRETAEPGGLIRDR